MGRKVVDLVVNPSMCFIQLPCLFYCVNILVGFFICVLASSMAYAQLVPINNFQIVNSTVGGLEGATSNFGRSVANIGDLDGDGVTDVAVGTKGFGENVIWILFLNANGTVKNQHRIRNSNNAGNWGLSLAYMGDLDGDNAPELAVGAPADFFGGAPGEVFILSLNTDGSVKRRQRIDGADYANVGSIGVSLANLGDLDGDGVAELAVGSIDPTNRGDALILFLNADATVKNSTKFSLDENPSGGETGYQQFGWSMASIGDFDLDGVPDLVIGKPMDNDGSDEGEYFSARGAVIIVLLNSDGTVKTYQKISDTDGGFAGAFRNGGRFGQSVACMGDLNEDGTPDIIVGAVSVESAQFNTLWVLFLNPDGTVKTFGQIDQEAAGIEAFDEESAWGEAIANIGDLDGNGIVDIMVGTPGDNVAGENSGATSTLFLDVTRIGSFTLVDATTDLPVSTFDPLRSGAVLNLDELPLHLNIRAHAGGSVESVRFEFEDEANYRTESIAPYALFGDTNGDFANGSLQPGNYTLTATPYMEDSGFGEAGFSRTISFSVVGTVPEGLVLWNTLGTDEEVVNSKIGPDLRFYTEGGGINAIGDAGYVSGVFGSGVTLTGQYALFQRVHNIVLDNANAFIDSERGAIEVWYKQNVDPVANLHNIWRVFGGGFGLGSDMGFQSFDGDFDDRQRFSFSLRFGGINTQVYALDTGFDGYNISPYNGEWIHLAGVWDRAGIDGTDDKMQLYLNGELVASTTDSGWGTEVGEMVDICSANDNSAGLFFMDNLKLWNYAKTDFSDRTTEDHATQSVPDMTALSGQKIDVLSSGLPGKVELRSNYPNPFNPVTTISFALPEAQQVKLSVFDILGREVAILVNSIQEAGAHEVVFDAKDLPSGTYLYLIETQGERVTRKMMLMK